MITSLMNYLYIWLTKSYKTINYGSLSNQVLYHYDFYENPKGTIIIIPGGAWISIFTINFIYYDFK